MSFLKHLSAIKDAWIEEDKRRKSLQKAQMDTEFLPAALEISQTPPSPIGRAIIWVIFLTFLIAIIWSIFGKIDVVAVGTGKISPIGRLQNIEAADTGTVNTIFVKEGDKVKQNQELISLNPIFAQADVSSTITQYNQANLAAARAKALLNYLKGGVTNIIAPPNASMAAVQSEQETVNARINALEQKLAAFDAQELASQSEIASAQSEIDKINSALPIEKSQLSGREELDKQGYGAKMVTLQQKEKVLGLEHDVKTQIEAMNKAKANLLAIKRQKIQAHEEFRAQAATELATAQSQSDALLESTNKAKEKAKQQILIAPINGTIVEVKATTIGETLEAGKPIITMVPDGQNLEVEALMLNKDIAFIKKGQKAVIKLEAYPFTRFGYLEGTVETIAADAINNEKLGLVYPVIIKLDSLNLKKGQKSIPTKIIPGMSANVEIATDKRRIIDFILSPIMKSLDEAGRER